MRAVLLRYVRVTVALVLVVLPVILGLQYANQRLQVREDQAQKLIYALEVYHVDEAARISTVGTARDELHRFLRTLEVEGPANGHNDELERAFTLAEQFRLVQHAKVELRAGRVPVRAMSARRSLRLPQASGQRLVHLATERACGTHGATEEQASVAFLACAYRARLLAGTTVIFAARAVYISVAGCLVAASERASAGRACRARLRVGETHLGAKPSSLLRLRRWRLTALIYLSALIGLLSCEGALLVTAKLLIRVWLGRVLLRAQRLGLVARVALMLLVVYFSRFSPIMLLIIALRCAASRLLTQLHDLHAARAGAHKLLSIDLLLLLW